LQLINDSDPAKAARAMQAMMRMQKIIIADIERAAYAA
jgi:predicted 3-demethylubiquinone-9 3-methyltransferase (glyoxalase superfamily)